MLPDGTVGEGRVLWDVTNLSGYGGPDGMKVDHLGNIFGAGRERIFVIAADGTHLGTIAVGSITTNLGWGEDGATLFITTERRLLCLRTCTRGKGF
jgi:gluconolactonase